MISFPRTLFTSADKDVLLAIERLPKESYYLEHGSRIYNNVADIGENKLIQIHFRLCGGKGGFGSLLRSFRIHKSTNQLMCRNLSGRRLADVKEEERLQRWIEKKEERGKEKERKKQEKYEKLKRGHPKHEFNDQDYLRKRDLILDQTEDAIEAGMKALEEQNSETKQALPEVSSSSSPSDDSDFDFSDALKLPSTSKKRKLTTVGEHVSKKLKVAYTSEVIFEYFLSEIVEEVAQLTVLEYQKQKLIKDQVEKREQEEAHGKENADVNNAKNTINCAEVPKKEFPLVCLDEIDSIKQLETLGLNHLKHALETRGLKCGGSLEERAARLFSVKDMNPDEYPKNIRAKK